MSIEELIQANTKALIENTASNHALIEALKAAEASRAAVVEQTKEAIASVNAPKRTRKSEEPAAAAQVEVTKPAEAAAPTAAPAAETQNFVSEEEGKNLLGAFVRDFAVPPSTESRKEVARDLMTKANGGVATGFNGLDPAARTRFVKLLKEHMEKAAQQVAEDDLM